MWYIVCPILYCDKSTVAVGFAAILFKKLSAVLNAKLFCLKYKIIFNKLYEKKDVLEKIKLIFGFKTITSTNGLYL